jgi:hypothetical protein
VLAGQRNLQHVDGDFADAPSAMQVAQLEAIAGLLQHLT